MTLIRKKSKPILLLIVTVLLLLVGCDNHEKLCTSAFFSKVRYNDTSVIGSVFKLHEPVLTNQKCGFRHEFNFWRSFVVNDKPVEELEWEGRLYEVGGSIYFELDSGNTFKYFDFAMNVGDSQNVETFILKHSDYLSKKVKVNTNYKLILEDKFYDSVLKDSVCKFRFYKIGVMFPETDMVIYINKDYGLIGAYHSALLGNGVEEIYSSVGRVFEQTDKKYIRRPVKGNIL